MAKILAIDYGKKKIGVAVADFECLLAEPLSVIRFEGEEEAVNKIGQIAKIENAERIVVGISEGEIAEKAREFGKKLNAGLNIPVVFQDETLTTHEAKEFSIQAQIKRKKRKEMEDAYAAAIILQNYLEKTKLHK